MAVAEIEATLMEIAKQCAARGPGFAQEGVVLREMRDRAQPKSLQEEQQILSAWQSLFTTGKLAWGHDLDNPGRPFYHIRSES